MGDRQVIHVLVLQVPNPRGLEMLDGPLEFEWKRAKPEVHENGKHQMLVRDLAVFRYGPGKSLRTE